MNTRHKIEQEKSVLRWGGMFGMLSGIVIILSMAIVITMMPADPATLEEWVTRFADIKTTRLLENTVYLTGVILSVPAFLAMYYALRKTNLAFALFGSVLGILGMCILMVGALPHIGVMPLADIYYAPETTMADKATLALLWQASQAIHESSLAVGLFVIPLAFLALGIAMLGSHAFGKTFAGFTLLLGVVGFAGAIINLINLSAYGALPVFALILFNIVMGWKLNALSRATGNVFEPEDGLRPALRTG